MLPHVIFLFVGTYQRSWFDEPWLFNNMTNNSTLKKNAMLRKTKKWTCNFIYWDGSWSWQWFWSW
jgi:hypothetical protein